MATIFALLLIGFVIFAWFVSGGTWWLLFLIPLIALIVYDVRLATRESDQQ